MSSLCTIECKWKFEGENSNPSYSSNLNSSAWTFGKIQLIHQNHDYKFLLSKSNGEKCKSYKVRKKSCFLAMNNPNRLVLSGLASRKLHLILPPDRLQRCFTQLKEAISKIPEESASPRFNQNQWSADEALDVLGLNEMSSNSPKQATTKLLKTPTCSTDVPDWVDRDLLKESPVPTKFYSNQPISRSERMLQQSLSKKKRKLGLMSLPDHSQFTSDSRFGDSVSLLGADSPKKPRLITFNKQKLTVNLSQNTGADDDDDDDNEPLYSKPLQGFSNIGNSCYMNAVLQSILSVETFTADLLTVFNNQGADSQGLVRSLSKLINHKRSIRPQKDVLKLMLKEVISTVASTDKRFLGNSQQDAHEFLCMTLDMIKEEVKTLQKKSPANVSTVSPTVNNFEFETITQLECLQCGKVAESNHTQNGLSVGIPLVNVNSEVNGVCNVRKVDTSIQDSLDGYFESEDLDYLCTECGHNSARSSHVFKKLPRILIITAKRYNFMCANSKLEVSLIPNKHITLESHCDHTTEPAKDLTTNSQMMKYLSKRLSLPVTTPKSTQEIEPDDRSVINFSSEKKPEQRNCFSFVAKRLFPTATGLKGGALSSQQLSSPAKESPKKQSTLFEHFPLTSLSDDDDEDLRKAIELSKKDLPNSVTSQANNESNSRTMTEEEMYDLAVQNSLNESVHLHKEKQDVGNQADRIQRQIDEDFSSDDDDILLMESHPNPDDANKENLKPDAKSLSKNAPNGVNMCSIQTINRTEDVYRRLCKHAENGSECGYSYQLVSIVSHLGSRSSSGHYISDAFDVPNKRWLSYDDSSVKETTRDEMCKKREKTGYIYFYMDRLLLQELTDLSFSYS